MSPPAKTNGRAAPPTRALTPREFFTAVFETVIEEAEANPAFAEKLAARLGAEVTISTRPSPRGRAEPPPELMALDLKALREELGELGLRERLEEFRNAELAAYIRRRKLAAGALSKKPKNSLINAILRAAR